MTPPNAIARWYHDLDDLQALQTGGKFSFEVTLGGVRLFYNCRSPVLRSDALQPVIEQLDHLIDVLRTEGWPAEPLTLMHRQPVGVLHPNIYFPRPDDTNPIRHFGRGLICYSAHASAGLRLATLAEHVYDMLGYRFGRYSRSLSDCLSPTAVRWVNQVLATTPELLPTERRPFIERPNPGATS